MIRTLKENKVASFEDNGLKIVFDNYAYAPAQSPIAPYTDDDLLYYSTGRKKEA